jgi:hypothetical protein
MNYSFSSKNDEKFITNPLSYAKRDVAEEFPSYG